MSNIYRYTQNDKVRCVSSIILCIINAIIVLSLFYRVFRSVETTDEIHGIASILNIIQGKKPFVSSWDYHTGWCLLAPLYSCFIRINGGSRVGIVLFSRVLYILFSVAIMSFIALATYRRTKNIISIILIGIVAWVPFSIFQLNYNTLTVYLILLGTFILVSLYRDKSKEWSWTLSGIVFGIACINYPTIAILTIVISTILLVKEWNKSRALKALFFSSGVIAVGILFFVWVIHGSSIKFILSGINGMLNSPHEASRSVGNSDFFEVTFTEPLKRYLRLNKEVLIYTLIQLLLFLFIGITRMHKKSKIEYVPFSLYVIFLLISFFKNSGPQRIEFFSFSFLVYTVVWVLCDFRILKKDILPYVGIEFAFILLYAFTSDNRNFLLGVHVSCVIIAFIAINSIISWRFERENNEDQDFVKDLALSIIAICILVLPGVLSSYSYVYRDADVNKLNARITSGVFKGLYTTQERAEFVTGLEELVNRNTTEYDTICVVTREPMIYVMSNSRILSPQTWDPQFLYRGNISAEPLISYFEMMNNRYPDIIIATNSDPSDFFDNDNYEIIDFINTNYYLYETDEVGDVRIEMYRLKGFNGERND